MIAGKRRQMLRNLEKVNAAPKTVGTSAGKAALARTVSRVFLAGDVKQAFERNNRRQAGAD